MSVDGNQSEGAALSEPLNEVTVDYVTAYASVGVEIADPAGHIMVDMACRYATIGFVVVWDAGGVTAVPTFETSAEQVGEIVRHAELALLDGVTDDRWWRRIPDQGWLCAVLEPVCGAPAPIPPSPRSVRRSPAPWQSRER